MQCDKCNGLMAKDAPDEYRCMLCSKRKYVAVATAPVSPMLERGKSFDTDLVDAHPLVKAVAELPPLSPPEITPWRCDFILAIRGTQCKSDRAKESKYCKRHRNGQNGLVPELPDDEQTDAKEPMPPEPVTKITRPARQFDAMPDFLPQELKFVLSRYPGEWGRFVLAWDTRFPEYELESVHDIKDDDANRVNIWLRLKKES